MAIAWRKPRPLRDDRLAIAAEAPCAPTEDDWFSNPNTDFPCVIEGFSGDKKTNLH